MAIRGKVFTGARCRFMLDGKQVGHGTGVDHREQIGYQAIRVLGKLEVASQEPTSYDVSLEIATVTIVGSSMKDLGFFPKAGREEGSRLRAILDQADLTATIEDSITGRVMGVITGVRMAAQSQSIQAGNLVMSRVTCVAVESLEASEL